MSNYDKMLASAQVLFLKYDQEAMIRRWTLENDGDYLYADYLGEGLRIHRRTGEVSYAREPAAGEYRADDPRGSALGVHIGQNSFGFVTGKSLDDQANADDHDHSRQQQLPHQLQIHNALPPQQQNHADGNADQVAGLLPLGHQTYRTGDNNKQGPPAVKEHIDVRKTGSIEAKDHTNGDQGQAQNDFSYLTHMHTSFLFDLLCSL